jgi:hypothetical protein
MSNVTHLVLIESMIFYVKLMFESKSMVLYLMYKPPEEVFPVGL